MDNSLRPLRRPARELIRAVVDLVLPPACVACGRPAAQFCPPCRRVLVHRPRPGCPRCGEPVLVEGSHCGGDHRHLRHISMLVAPLAYAGTGGRLVRRFKLDADPAAAGWLVRAMAAAWARAADTGWRRAWLVPIPLHARRRRRRGFDQAAWLAAALGTRLGLPVPPSLLVRTRDTLPQGDPRVLSRQGNVDLAFRLRQPGRVQGRRIVLVDDVFTSGATTRACAALLRQAGAEQVAVLVACRS